METLEKSSQDAAREKQKKIVREIVPSGPSLASKTLLAGLTSIEVPDSVLSTNADSGAQSQRVQMSSQFDPQQRLRLGTAFSQSLRDIDNEAEKSTFISEGNEKNRPVEKIKEFEESIKKVDSRLSQESITSNSQRKNPEIRALFDDSVVQRFGYAQPRQKSQISVAELLNQQVNQKVPMRPEDPMDYISQVVGRSYNSFVPNLDRYKPIKSVDEIYRERGQLVSS